MSKCGKGCMPECKYFTTGGCISPFNCLYKVEEIYSNSATSTPAYYAGTSYTEAQPDESESGIRKWYRESVGHEPANYDAATLKIYIAHLEAENAELRARLEKADRRTEVAERALFTACINLIKDEEDNVNMELLAHVVYTKYLRKTEKELQEERKDV